MPFHQLTDTQLDAVREVSNIGMGHAATALSQMIGQRVELRVPQVMVAPIAKVPDCLGGPEKLMAGIFLQILGEARGNIMLLFPEQSACHLCNALLGRKEKCLILDEDTASTLKEVGNILASAYLNALGSLMRRTLIPSVPCLAYDMAGALVDAILIDLGQSGDLALMIETEFGGDIGREKPVRGHFFLIPDPQTFETFLMAAGGIR
ncbi:MAG: chemotaxis protein CheC [Desulfuromonadales bacterium]|jgi:chemotaxis protein CheC|nr:chemotaxis protein CheC [Desulfuromonadales bacterium]